MALFCHLFCTFQTTVSTLCFFILLLMYNKYIGTSLFWSFLSQKFYKKIGCIFLSFSVTHVLRNGIPQWWWFDVSHSTVWKIRFRTGKILLCRNHVGIKILTQKRHRLQVIIDLSGFFQFEDLLLQVLQPKLFCQ